MKRIIVITFYDKENKLFYQAVKFGIFNDAVQKWLVNLNISELSNFLYQMHETDDYESDFLESCPCKELLLEMNRMGFYYCNFENCDYTWGAYQG